MFENIPSILKDVDNWLCYDDRDNIKDNEKKAPRDLKGKLLKEWTKKGYSFNECIKSIEQGYNSGLGLVLKNNGIVILDYDKCLSDVEVNDKLDYIKPIFKDKESESSILSDINTLKSYTEISPSGKGLHIVVLADKKDIYTTKPIEIYSYNKYIRFTGNSVFNDYDLVNANNELLEIIDKYNVKIDKSDDKIVVKDLKFNKSIYEDIILKNFKYSNGYTPKQIIDTMFNGKKGNFIKKLFNDELSDNEYLNYKIDEIEKKYKKGIISEQKRQYMIARVDKTHSGKRYTLILYLIDACYGSIETIKNVYMMSKLCNTSDLDKKYKGGLDSIDYDIRQALIGGKEHNRYKNYREV
jgi:putative DNA primase/helicase